LCSAASPDLNPSRPPRLENARSRTKHNSVCVVGENCCQGMPAIDAYGLILGDLAAMSCVDWFLTAFGLAKGPRLRITSSISSWFFWVFLCFWARDPVDIPFGHLAARRPPILYGSLLYSCLAFLFGAGVKTVPVVGVVGGARYHSWVANCSVFCVKCVLGGFCVAVFQ